MHFVLKVRHLHTILHQLNLFKKQSYIDSYLRILSLEVKNKILSIGVDRI